MATISHSPISFVPYLKTVVWGGNKICRYKRLRQSEPKVGESWEISEIPGHVSVVADGIYTGMNLSELIAEFGEELLGHQVLKKYQGKFPLLIKFIDADDNLSVQVHPDDKLAQKRHNCPGKTEMWYIIDAEKNAKIYAGLKQEISPVEYLRRVSDNTFSDILAVHESQKGDVFFLPAGRVHAIGRGNLLAEIQESSDVTYRIFDYNRKDESGLTRELHTDLAKDAIDFSVQDNYKEPSVPQEASDYTIADCNHFTTRRIKIKGTKKLLLGDDSFSILIGIEGECVINIDNKLTHLLPGQTFLLPACIPQIAILGEGTVLLVRS